MEQKKKDFLYNAVCVSNVYLGLGYEYFVSADCSHWIVVHLLAWYKLQSCNIIFQSGLGCCYLIVFFPHFCCIGSCFNLAFSTTVCKCCVIEI